MMTTRARVRVERKKTNAVQKWTLTTTGPSGVSRRRHFLTRSQAISQGASFLVAFDDKVEEARGVFHDVMRAAQREYVAAIEAEAEQEPTDATA